jgi:hypothetical protein
MDPLELEAAAMVDAQNDIATDDGPSISSTPDWSETDQTELQMIEAVEG